MRLMLLCCMNDTTETSDTPMPRPVGGVELELTQRAALQPCAPGASIRLLLAALPAPELHVELCVRNTSKLLPEFEGDSPAVEQGLNDFAFSHTNKRDELFLSHG